MVLKKALGIVRGLLVFRNGFWVSRVDPTSLDALGEEVNHLDMGPADFSDGGGGIVVFTPNRPGGTNALTRLVVPSLGAWGNKALTRLA